MPKYLLDSNIMINAHRRTYPFDIAPGFWTYLIEKGDEGLVILCDQVKQEILKNNDTLSSWLSQNLDSFQSIESSSPNILATYSLIINLVKADPQYTESAKREFASEPDSWLIAIALAEGLTIVTEEVFSQASKKVKIPNECKRNNIAYINTIQFMRDTNFIWK